MAEQPISIDGMKLVFDEKVALFPVAAEINPVEKPPEKRERRNANGQ